MGALLIHAKNVTPEVIEMRSRILEYMNENMTAYMIPTKRMIVKQVVLSKNGKVDRQQTLALLAVKQTAERRVSYFRELKLILQSFGQTF